MVGSFLQHLMGDVDWQQQAGGLAVAKPTIVSAVSGLGKNWGF